MSSVTSAAMLAVRQAGVPSRGRAWCSLRGVFFVVSRGRTGRYAAPRVSRPLSYASIAAVAAVPRLVVLAVERGKIVSAFTDKGDAFARSFVASGTYGFVPGHPSAYTQPLYGFFLVPLYWIFGRHWLVVGLAQTALALATALLVYVIGTRIALPRTALAAALISTLNPYLVWHDVHVNREIVDQVVGAALVLCTVMAVQRRSLPWAAGAGVLAGLAVLGNSRLVLVPLVLAV